MSWSPKRYDPPPEEEKPCPKCEWKDWEKASWFTVLALAIAVSYAEVISNVLYG